jgi:glucokinase
LLPQKPDAIAVGFGGPVNRRSGNIESSHQIEGWQGFPLEAWLRDLCRVPVCIENDANVAALGEALCGAGQSFDPVFWINMGSGVGGGLVAKGQLYEGAVPGEAEIGHVRLDRSGTTLEQRCSGWAMDARIRDRINGVSDESSVLAAEVRRIHGTRGSGGESKALKRAYEFGDALAIALIKEWADDMAYALGHVVQLFHPEVIVLGGGLSLVGEPLRGAVAERLPHYVMDSFQPGPQVLLAGLGEDAVPVGCLCLAAARFC